ncbi:aspartate aminotransferase family protein [Cereibacter changlensis JA139]|uniref:Aspartate aminotransferase family protein n=2 Tax=Cereibacter changlensis TaxID=402884 RepID=A0A2T4JTW3_9RHOB|nr:aspartate aminotransferase family protein [Cereibacter changlensis]PTE21349.1 aspartate aminotransferase family protein [Cereibacter changlensis JA139]PZX56110.1 adenosylmethionine-8-amino-7-oxononanoate aminotransferase [Cereibacter changlensis]
MPSDTLRNTRSHLFYQTGHPRPVLDRAEGIYMWDSEGNRFIDGSSGAMVCNIGHSNPAVLAAMQAQMERFTFGYRLHFVTEASEALAAKTASLAWPGMDRVFFVSGGSEAVESAIKLARQYAIAIGQPSRWKIISRSPSYHGCTLGALAISGYEALSDPFLPMMQAMPKVSAPRAWLDGLDPADPATGAHYAAELERKILEEGPDSVLGFILEPVGGASTGALVPPAGYMEAVREVCTRHGVLLIHDEVMSGGGRTGRFLGGQNWTAAPDILAVSKGFGAGYVPLGAMVAQGHIVDAVMAGGGFLHGFTYAGNPLACAAGLAVIAEIERQDMMGNAQRTGALLKRELEGLMPRFPFIGEVRGMGLLLALELVADRDSKEPLPPELRAFDRLTEQAYQRGLIIYPRRSRGGYSGDHVLIAPPMITTPAQVGEIMERLTDALTAFAAECGLEAVA